MLFFTTELEAYFKTKLSYCCISTKFRKNMTSPSLALASDTYRANGPTFGDEMVGESKRGRPADASSLLSREANSSFLLLLSEHN